MREILRKLPLFVLFLSTWASGNFAIEVDYEFYLGGGYRKDKLSWDVAGPSGVPNVLSELSWKDLEIGEVKAFLSLYVPCNNLYLRLKGDYGKIFHGKNIDRDFASDDRQNEFSRSVNNAGKGHVYDASIGLGYPLCFFCEQLELIPVVGYSYYSQHLNQFDGFQVVGFELENEAGEIVGGVPVGSFHHLHSNYRAKWGGPWVGFDWVYSPCAFLNGDLSFFGSFEYHWTRFHARGHWNLRSDFVNDFKQHAWGHGPYVSVGTNYNFWCNWSLATVFEYQYLHARNGKDRCFFSSHSVQTRLNRVKWQSWSVSGLLGYNF